MHASVSNPPRLRRAPRRHALRPLALATALLSALLIAPAALANHPKPDVPKIDWADCPVGPANAQCATVQVPVDYDQPRGAKTRLALARIPASDPANKIGTLFLNPGGPGGSGVSLITGGFGNFLDRTLLGRFDIVGFDPRGVGDSTPIQCWEDDAARNAYFTGVLAFPYERSQQAAYFQQRAGIAGLCFGRSANLPILRNMNTADVVRDLDLLREAVGDKKLTYLGYSYGSHIGNTYANLFPHKVRALVIDGVLDPRLWTAGFQIQADRDASFQVLEQFFAQCDAAGAACGLSGPSGSKARFDALLNFVRTTPILLGDGAGGVFEYSYDLFVADSASVMYSPEIWPNYAFFLGLLNDAVIGGDRAAAGRALSARAAMVAAVERASPKRATYDNGLEAYYGNHCADAQYPSILPLFSALDRYARAGSFQGPFWLWNNAACARWPVNDDRYVGPWVTRTASPVLVVGNYYDPATDYDGAVSSNRLLLNSRLLSYAGWGHTAAYSGRSECVDDYVSLYLLDGSLPPRGTVCPAAPNPFGAAVAARGAQRMPAVGLPKLEPLPKR
jgi:pimeloyl-ACP methyl ester carboxylesterase